MSLKERLSLSSDPIFLMDGSAFIFRSFFATRQMQRSDGFPTNALVIISRILLNILRDEAPLYFAFFKDGKGRTFRHDLYGEYKANRHTMPDDLVCQLAPIRQMVEALGIKFIETSGVEADDCIASLAAKFSDRHPVVIVSSDKDLKQCLGDNVFMWDPGSRDGHITTMRDFVREEGILPAVWPDFQALVGDSSDNIPGIAGIGPKTARKILELCRNLEDIKDNFGTLPPKIQDKLGPGMGKMFLWRELTTLRKDQCQDLSLDSLSVQPIDVATCASLAREFELSSFQKELAKYIESRRMERIKTSNADVAGQESADTESGFGGTGKHGVQLSIPDLASPEIDFLALPQSEACEKCRTEDLPDCDGCNVAIIWPDVPDAFPCISLCEKELSPDEASLICEYEWRGSCEALCSWLEKARRIVIYDLKKLLVDFPAWRNLYETSRPEVFFDVSLAAYLLNTDIGDYSLVKIANAWAAPLLSMNIGAPAICLYMCNKLEARLENEGLLGLYRNLEMPLIPVLANMELRGIKIDSTEFGHFLEDVSAHLEELTDKIYAEAGERFNLRSAQQLSAILYHKLALPASSKTVGGMESTSQQVLEKLSLHNPIVDNILCYRKLEKIRSTYLCPLLQHMDDNGRIHTVFNQKGTATGRLSSSNPNLQNIPVRGPLGKHMRECFIAGENNLLISADYSQIELRILAHFSNDAALLDAFRAGEDIHTRTAALIYDEDPGSISAEQRRAAKTINFGLIYGMGAQKLARELKITTQKAKEFISLYFRRLSGLKEFYDSVVATARKSGFITTIGGRRRFIPNIMSGNGQAFALARRQAINTMIQGSAADIIKLAMLAVENDRQLSEMGSQMLLQIHDELLLEIPEENSSQAGERVAGLMAAVRPGGEELSVPLVVDWGIGKNWGSAH